MAPCPDTCLKGLKVLVCGLVLANLQYELNGQKKTDVLTIPLPLNILSLLEPI
jgi:hypothetical protein